MFIRFCKRANDGRPWVRTTISPSSTMRPRPPNTSVNASVTSGYEEVTTLRLRVHSTGGSSPPTATKRRQPSYFISAAQAPSICSGGSPGVASIGAISRMGRLCAHLRSSGDLYGSGARECGSFIPPAGLLDHRRHDTLSDVFAERRKDPRHP